MTEKQYGGNTGRGKGEKSIKIQTNSNIHSTKKSPQKNYLEGDSKTPKLTDEEKILKAGEIASKTREYAKTIIKKDMLLLEIAEKIEKKIEELGGKIAFPTNLSINEIAAHHTPSYEDKKLAHGLLKIDLGVHIEGWIADTAFSVDLDNNEENTRLIKASEKALEKAIEIANTNTPLSEIGKTIQKEIEGHRFSPIINLCGHSMEQYTLHSGITIPNIDNSKSIPLGEGLRAIEPFATNGVGKIKDSKPSEIYMLIEEKTPRSQIAREVLEFITKEYQTLPFCSRWIIKKFGLKAIIGLKQLEENGNLHRFAQLVEESGGKVSQSEHTILINKKEKRVTTL